MALEPAKGAPDQNIFHAHGQAENRHFRAGCDAAQFPAEGQRCKSQPPAVGGLALDDRNEFRARRPRRYS
jgi:hypothetical protein